MTQLQVYSNGLSLYYLISYFIKVAFIGCLLLFVFQKIQNQLKKYVDYINLLESKLREINETHDTLSRDFIVYKEENKNLINEFTHTIINCNEHMRLLEDNLCQINIDKKLNDKLIENTCNEFTHKIINCNERMCMLEDNLCQINIDKKLNDKLIENTCDEYRYMKSEISNIYSHINDKHILIGYKLDQEIIIPVFESSIAYNISTYCCNCFIVSQLKYLKNIKEINIMMVLDKMFIFDNIELNELYSIKGSHGWAPAILNFDRLIQEKYVNYLVVSQGMLSYSNGIMWLLRPEVSYKEKMYVKNGVKKLYNQLKADNIELTMPDELRDWVFK